VPFFIDLNDYKAEIAAKAKEATGRDLAIDGNISLSILPTPTVTVAGLRFGNAPGGSVPGLRFVSASSLAQTHGNAKRDHKDNTDQNREQRDHVLACTRLHHKQQGNAPHQKQRADQQPGAGQSEGSCGSYQLREQPEAG